MNHPDGPNKLPSMKDTGQHRILPPVKTTLENYFQVIPLNYSEHEVDHILKKYRRDSDSMTGDIRAILDKIMPILQATKSFLMGSSMDEYFKGMRDAANDDNALNTLLTDMHKALFTAQEQLKNKDKNPALQLVFTQAVDYCKKCITNRINELKLANDKIYVLYQNHLLKDIFELKKFIPNRK